MKSKQQLKLLGEGSDDSVIANKNGNISQCSCKSPIESTSEDKKTIQDLPEEVLALILIRLPLKYLLRCRCVQKSWHYLVQSSSFITLHLNYQKTKKNLIPTHSRHPKYLFFRHEYGNRLNVRIDDVQCEQYCTIKNIPDLPRSLWLAQSNGLICVTSFFNHYLGYQGKPNIYLWNPLIEKYKTLPDSPLGSFSFKENSRSSEEETGWIALAFGFVPEDNDYVVVHIVKPPLESAPDPHSVMIGVYSLKSNSWKIKSQDNVFVCGIRMVHHVLVDGVAYWLGIKPDGIRQIIMCFDTKTDVLQEITLPDWVDCQDYLWSPFLHPFGESIAYFVENVELNHFDMWVLKRDPKNDCSWEQKLSVSLSREFRTEVLGLRNNGEPIVFRLFKLASYNLDSHETNDFVDSWQHWDDFSCYQNQLGPPFAISPFVESLVLLN